MKIRSTFIQVGVLMKKIEATYMIDRRHHFPAKIDGDGDDEDIDDLHVPITIQLTRCTLSVTTPCTPAMYAMRARGKTAPTNISK